MKRMMCILGGIALAVAFLALLLTSTGCVQLSPAVAQVPTPETVVVTKTVEIEVPVVVTETVAVTETVTLQPQTTAEWARLYQEWSTSSPEAPTLDIYADGLLSEVLGDHISTRDYAHIMDAAHAYFGEDATIYWTAEQYGGLLLIALYDDGPISLERVVVLLGYNEDRELFEYIGAYPYSLDEAESFEFEGQTL